MKIDPPISMTGKFDLGFASHGGLEERNPKRFKMLGFVLQLSYKGTAN
ncbi:MAG: hypothetical protein GY749_14505 [Desulfobacteraceae bacterium]|nr:hypothetical protein [Desulfobacteraceae bacterium]